MKLRVRGLLIGFFVFFRGILFRIDVKLFVKLVMNV